MNRFLVSVFIQKYGFVIDEDMQLCNVICTVCVVNLSTILTQDVTYIDLFIDHHFLLSFHNIFNNLHCINPNIINLNQHPHPNIYKSMLQSGWQNESQFSIRVLSKHFQFDDFSFRSS